MGAHGLDFTTSGAATGNFAPQTNPALQQVIEVMGITAENTGTGAATILVRDGGSTGRILAAVPVPALANAAAGTADRDFHHPRTALNGIYIEVDGTGATIAGTVWVK